MSTWTKGIATIATVFLLLVSFACISSAAHHHRHHRRRQPCRELALYFHDVAYNGGNSNNATSAIVAVPPWAHTKTNWSTQMRYGDVVVFDNPITVERDVNSSHVGRAQGMYFYDRKDSPTAWFGFSIYFNSTYAHGTITMVGPDPTLVASRDLSVVGGTGEFFMARGVATLTTDSIVGDFYFRLRMDIKLYECW